MTHTNPLRFWQVPLPNNNEPINRPLIEAWHTAKECIQPIEAEYPFKPWDAEYDRRKDPAMIILDANTREIKRRDAVAAAKIDREYKRRVKWGDFKSER